MFLISDFLDFQHVSGRGKPNLTPAKATPAWLERRIYAPRVCEEVDDDDD